MPYDQIDWKAFDDEHGFDGIFNSQYLTHLSLTRDNFFMLNHALGVVFAERGGAEEEDYNVDEYHAGAQQWASRAEHTAGFSELRDKPAEGGRYHEETIVAEYYGADPYADQGKTGSYTPLLIAGAVAVGGGALLYYS